MSEDVSEFNGIDEEESAGDILRIAQKFHDDIDAIQEVAMSKPLALLTSTPKGQIIKMKEYNESDPCGTNYFTLME